MTVPTDNLYDFIHQATEKRYWLLRFYPWGSRCLVDCGDYQFSLEHLKGPNGIPNPVVDQLLPQLLPALSYEKQVRNFQPILFCHDQEPLNYDLYQDYGSEMAEYVGSDRWDSSFPHPDFNLRNTIVWSWQRMWTLLHSELNSPELEKYERTGKYAGAYWWSHAMISLDWYRYAEYDRSLQHSDINKLFLIYARDFSGTRTYRKDFLDQITSIESHCQIGSVGTYQATSASSAVYCSEDFNCTGVSVVLETLFDDPRIHLTEKTLRPIACGHPFILAAGPGSLALLQKYGFETFSPWIDESYDTIANSEQRMAAIVAEMQRLTSLSAEQQKWVLESCRAVAERNKKRFFHRDFFDHIVKELVDNVNLAWKRHQGQLSPDFYWQTLRWRRRHKPDYFTPDKVANQRVLLPLIRQLRQSLKQNQSHQHGLDDKSSTNGDDV